VWSKVDSVFDAQRLKEPLHPTRSLKHLSEVTPPTDRRTDKQRKWCAAVEPLWEMTGLKEQRHWWEANVLLSLIGTSRRTTQTAIAFELRREPLSVRRAIDRMVGAELLTLKEGVGRRGQESDFVPNWDKLQTISEASTNGKPRSKGKPKARPMELVAQLTTKRTGGRKPKWDAACRVALRHKEEHPDATWTECIAVFHSETGEVVLPTPKQLVAAIPKYLKRHGLDAGAA
jgi:hypothetical protein